LAQLHFEVKDGLAQLVAIRELRKKTAADRHALCSCVGRVKSQSAVLCLTYATAQASDGRGLASDWTHRHAGRRGERGDDSGRSFPRFGLWDVMQKVSAPEIVGAA
jgi:hypothetical protein